MEKSKFPVDDCRAGYGWIMQNEADIAKPNCCERPDAEPG